MTLESLSTFLFSSDRVTVKREVKTGHVVVQNAVMTSPCLTAVWELVSMNAMLSGSDRI